MWVLFNLDEEKEDLLRLFLCRGKCELLECSFRRRVVKGDSGKVCQGWKCWLLLLWVFLGSA